MVQQRQQEAGSGQAGFHLLVGVLGVVLLLVAWVLRRDSLSTAMQLVYLLGAVVLVAWTASGVVAARRAAREAAAREEEARVQAEAQEAAQHAVQTVMARRTTSHGGMAITVRRTGQHDGTTDTRGSER